MKEPSQTKLPLITIDGPAGVGKSTIAKLLATKLNLPYLDTGAMFRVLALKLSLGGEDSTLPTLDFTLTGIGDKTKLFCNREPIGDEIRSEKIGMLASRIAKRPEIRSILATIQRKMGN